MRSEHLDVCIAGPTGWAGSELAIGIGSQPDMKLVAGVTREGAFGHPVRQVDGCPGRHDGLDKVLDL